MYILFFQNLPFSYFFRYIDSISHRVVPPVPSNRSSFDVRANLEAISTNYDEIRDGGRQVTDPQQLHNLYAEINPRTGSGAVSGGTQDGSERNSTSLFRTGCELLSCHVVPYVELAINFLD